MRLLVSASRALPLSRCHSQSLCDENTITKPFVTKKSHLFCRGGAFFPIYGGFLFLTLGQLAVFAFVCYDGKQDNVSKVFGQGAAGSR